MSSSWGLSNGSGRPSTLGLCAAAAGAAAAGVTLWLVWPRRPQPTRQEAVAALSRLRTELAAAYADIAGTVGHAGFKAPAKRSGVDTERSRKDDPVEKLRQAIEQPLILKSALIDATGYAVADLFPGATPEDLEALCERFSEEPEVQKLTLETRAMHEECLTGHCSSSQEADSATEQWGQEAVLKMLRELGEAKVDSIRELYSKADSIGPTSAVRACAEAEELIWQKRCKSDKTPSIHQARRRSFQTALERWSALDRGFRNRREKVERELDGLAKVALTTTTKTTKY